MKVNVNGYSSIDQAAAAYLSGSSNVTLTVDKEAPVKG